MKKIYTVIQLQFQEEDYGRCASAESLVHGSFSSEELAKEWVSKQVVPIFYAQFGDAEESFQILEFELDSLTLEPKEITHPFTAYTLQMQLGWEKFCDLTGVDHYVKNSSFEIKDSEIFHIKESDIVKYNLQ